MEAGPSSFLSVYFSLPGFSDFHKLHIATFWGIFSIFLRYESPGRGAKKRPEAQTCMDQKRVAPGNFFDHAAGKDAPNFVRCTALVTTADSSIYLVRSMIPVLLLRCACPIFPTFPKWKRRRTAGHGCSFSTFKDLKGCGMSIALHPTKTVKTLSLSQSLG